MHELAKVPGPLDDLVQILAEDFSTHPGFMSAPGGFEVLHADWPAYPPGHGVSVALRVLAEFPPGTPLYRIDEIDRCSLFVVGRKPNKDPNNPQFLHVALWDDDLAFCAKRGFIAGVEDDGEFLQTKSEFVTLTPDGAYAALVSELTSGVDEELLSEVIDHLYARKYDTAVREAALRVEVAMKEACAIGAFGQNLIETCFAENGSLVLSGLPNAHRLAIRSAFRSYFAYVRNEYAHNIPATDMLTACRLVRRSSDLLRCVTVLKAMKSGG